MASHRAGFAVGHGLRGLESFLEGIIEPSAQSVVLSLTTGLQTLLEWYNYIFIYMRHFLERD